jgi:surfactin synthase thioesterase subunit/glycosyltransferase involved in cell wall biosynthesis
MRILLAQNSLYYPAHGGGDKSNRMLIEALAARGHSCRVVARLSTFGEEAHQRYLGELAARGVPVASSDSGVVVFNHHGVEAHVVTNNPHLRAYFLSQIADFNPSVILNSTDDPAQVLLEAALKAESAHVVYLTRATLAVPFGPDCAFPSAAKTDLLRQADGVVGVSRYVAEYIRKWSGIEAVALPISLLEPGPYPDLGRFENDFVTLVNPCAVKGISIFLDLASRFPSALFAAVPTWGTNEKDRAALAALPNVRMLAPVDNIDDLLARTRALLVPSLWAEARSRIVVEAMLRGVPVLASNVGGIPEAKLGVPYLLPVRPIEKYQTRLDEQMVPLAEVPPQDTGPWAEALGRLLDDRAHYEELSRASRNAAIAYADGLSVKPFESFLEQVVSAPRRPRTAATAAQASPLDRLSPEKRRLLALRMRRKSSPGGAWFPNADPTQPAALRLFCFPHAGGGTLMFRTWAAALPEGVAVIPVRLPGRETRISEPPIERMGPLAEALAQAIRPFTGERFAFYGHSMGAVIAFELARELRRQGLPAPAGLFVSAARAPQFRLNHVPPPEPSDAQLIAELRRLEGVPAEALADEELVKTILPVVRADSALYRNYVYTEEPPLECPIRAYGGTEDPNITRDHLEAWARQTTASFALEMLPGGHFFVNSPPFTASLARDLCGTVLLAN